MNVKLLVGTMKGAFLFTGDAGRDRWLIDGPLFKGWKVTAAHRLPDGSYLVATASDVYGPALHKSEDLSTWRQIERGPAYGNGDRKLGQIWRIASGHGRTLAGVDEAGLFESHDGGESWSPISGLNDHPTRDAWFPGAGGLCAHAILFDSEDADRLWCGISAVGVFRSDDGGATWTPKNRGVQMVLEDQEYKDIGFCVHALAQDPDDAGVIYRQDHRGMFRTRDGGDSWERNEEGLPSSFGFPIAIGRHTKALYSVPIQSDEYRLPPGGALRVFRSEDGGDTWDPLTRGLPQSHFYGGVLRGSLVVDDLDPCGVYFGTTAGTVHASNDGGDSWTTMQCTLPRVLSVAAWTES